MNLMELFIKLSADTSALGSGFAEARGMTDKFTSDSGGKMGKFHAGVRKAAKIGAAALAAATGAAVAFGKASIDAGKEFDSSMSQVGATMGFTVEELNDKTSDASKTMEELRNFAMDMGASTAFSASEAADALNYMALAGYDAKTSMDMLPTVLNLAAAGGIELATASDMVTDAQTALGLSIDETRTMVDQMAKASSKSNTSVQQLGDAFLTVGGTAKNLKGGTQELSTVLGLLADNGIKGSEAGTHLRNIMLALSAPTDKAAKELDHLGVAVSDSQGHMRSMEDIMYDLNAAMADMGDDQKIQTINKIFNKTDISSVNALLATSSERWAELDDAIGNAEGAAQDMANVQLDNLEGDITLFKSALEGLQITISDVLTPTYREFVQFAGASLQELSTAFREGGLNAAMETLGDSIANGISLITSNLPAMVDAGTQLILALVDAIIDNLPQILDAAIQIVFNLAKGIGDKLPTLIPKMIEAVAVMVKTLLSNGPKLVQTAGELIKSLARGIGASVPIVIAAIPPIISGMLKTLGAAVGEFASIGGNLIQGLWNGIKNKGDWVVSQIKGLGSSIINAVKSVFGIHSPSKVFREIGGFIVDGFAEGIEPIGELTSGGTIKLTSKATTRTDSGVADAIADMNRNMYNAMSAALDNHVIEFNGRELGRMVKSYV